MFGPIRAVAIDDEPGHLLSITTGLSCAGIPCIGYWFNRDTADLVPPPPAGGLPHLRLIFTDLNLQELGGVQETAALWGVIAHVLTKVVSKDAGPYILVFWTRIEGKADEVKEMLYARAAELKVPLPLDVVTIKKGAFLPAAPEAGAPFDRQLLGFYEDLSAKLDALKKVISETVGTQPVINAASAWESRVAEAAASTVNHVHRIGKDDEADHKLAADSMSKVLGRIATAASGRAAAIDEPAKALDAGLADILIDRLGSTVDSNPYKPSVQSAIGEVVKQELIGFTDPLAIRAALNTFFQVDQTVTSVKSWDRGAVLKIERPNFHTSNLGFNPTALLESEFLHPAQALFPNEDQEVQRTKALDDLREIRRNARGFVLVELGADCDHAQDSNRTRRFLLGLEVSKENHYLTQGKHGALRNGSLELFGPWKLNGTVKYLLVSCRRYWTHQSNTPPLAEIKYRLRGSVVNQLLHRYASHASRLGIVEF